MRNTKTNPCGCIFEIIENTTQLIKACEQHKPKSRFEQKIAEAIENSKKPAAKIVWQIEEWTERAEGIAKIVGYDEAGNKYEASAIIAGSLTDGSIETIEGIELVKAKPTRPDLSFITSQKFEDESHFHNWFNNLSFEKREIVVNFKTLKLPELIQCAEMLFDANKDKPDSIVFKVVSETLNVGK